MSRKLSDLLKLPTVGASNQTNRDKWLQKTLEAIPPGSRILDAGAGELKYKRFCEHLDYVSQDFAQYDGVGDGTGLQTGTWDQSRLDIVSDITQIPEKDGAFDAIMCIEVLEHVPQPVEAVIELTRLLRPGGFLILTAPFSSLTHYAPYFFQTGYSRYFYEHWLGQLGYDILDLSWNGNYFEYVAQELRRLPSIAQSHANDRLSIFEKIALRIMLRACQRFSAKNQGSEQLGAFGLQVLAQKHG